MKIEVTTTGDDSMGLREILQRYADEFWLANHLTDEQAGLLWLVA